MADDTRKDLEEALKADQEKALEIVMAMEKLHKEIWGEPPEEE